MRRIRDVSTAANDDHVTKTTSKATATTTDPTSPSSTTTANEAITPQLTRAHITRYNRIKKLHHPMRSLPRRVCNDTAAQGSGVLPC